MRRIAAIRCHEPHRRNAYKRGRPRLPPSYKILYSLREACILDRPRAQEGHRSWRMRDPDSRRGRAARSVRRQVPGSGVRASRVREKDPKDTATKPRRGASPVAHAHRSSRKSTSVTTTEANDDARITPSSGNVFLDLGFPPGEAEHLSV